MLVVYPIGTPLLYFGILVKYRKAINPPGAVLGVPKGHPE